MKMKNILLALARFGILFFRGYISVISPLFPPVALQIIQGSKGEER